MKKVFISIPMNNRTEKEVSAEMEKIMTNKFPGAELIETYITDDMTPIEMIGESIKRMSDADIVFFAKGWQNARGCRIEKRVCDVYGKEYIVEAEPDTYMVEFKDVCTSGTLTDLMTTLNPSTCISFGGVEDFSIVVDKDYATLDETEFINRHHKEEGIEMKKIIF